MDKSFTFTTSDQDHFIRMIESEKANKKLREGMKMIRAALNNRELKEYWQMSSAILEIINESTK